MTKTKKIVNLVLIISIIAALAGFSIACGNQEAVQEETQMTEEQVEETATVETTAEETVASASISSGDFAITSVTDTEICGKFSIDEKWTKMSGDFKVPVTD